jgi:large subunit ribosomal protein L7/L12
MADINAIAEQIQGLTLLEASQLVKMLEEKLGVSAAAASVAVAAPGAGGGGAAAAPAAEEKTEFTVVLTAAGANKIKEEAETIRKKFTDAGATVEVK